MKTTRLFQMEQVIFLLFSALFLLISCSKKEIIEPQEQELPPLTDSILYKVLGNGIIVFERIGPYPGEYSGCYVVDLDQRKSWEFDYALSTAYWVSPNGEKITFTKYSGSTPNYDVYTVDIDGNNIQIITEMECHERFPSWSPDGSKLFFGILVPHRGCIHNLQFPMPQI